MKKRALAVLLAFSMLIPNGLGANVASAATSNTTITVDSMDNTTTDAGEVISGDVSSSKTITNVIYEATSEDGEVYAENTATVDGQKWSVDDLLLRPGENTVDITVKTSDGKKTNTSVTVTYDSGSFEDVTDVTTSQDGNTYASEQLVVMFQSGISQERCREIIEEVGGEQIGVLYAVDEYQVEFEGANAKVLENAIKKFQSYDEVIVADYNYVNEVEALPNDPWGGQDEWTEDNPTGYNWGMEAIHAESAWKYQKQIKLASNNKAAIKVGISDAGFDMDHEDLDLKSISTSTKEHRHGTHVAGTICGVGNNDIGVTGVLWNADTIVKSDMGYSYAVQLIQNGAKVVNCSWGLTYPSESSGRSTGITAANAMAKLLDQGYDFLVVQSSGNDTLDSTWNGSFCGITEETQLGNGYNVTIDQVMDHKVVVGAVQNLGNNTFQTASYSNYGKYVDVVAPGSSIYSARPDDTYGLGSGTSMAAPHVTGALAYIWSLNPNLTGAEVKNIMLNNTSIQVKDYSASKSGVDSYPMVDLYLASKAVVEGSEEGTAVYFDNSVANWNQVYAYVWSDGVQAKVLPTTLIDEEKNIYKVNVPEEYNKIIFKNSENGWDIQTGDLVVPGKINNCWKPDGSYNRASGTWYTYDGGSIVTPTPIVTPTTAPTATPIVTPTTAPTATPGVQNYVTVEFDNSVSGWENVYAYVWNNSSDSKVFTPAYVSGNYVIFNIEGSYKNVIFKNKEDSWDQQTADLILPKYTASADDKCFKPYSSGNKSNGTWGKSERIYNYKSIVPSVSVDKDTVALGETVTFTMNAQYENGHYLNFRSLTFVYEDGTKELVRSSDSSSYARVFTPAGGYKHIYTWKPAKTGKIKVIYNVNQYQDHGEDSQAIVLSVTGQMPTIAPTATPIVTPTIAPTATPIVTPTVAPTATPIVQNYVTVDFDNSVSGWENVCAYVWNNSTDSKVFTPAYISGNHVIFNIEGAYKNIIFKNTEEGWDQQTADLILPKYTASADDKCFKPYSAGNKSSGTWGKSDRIYNYKSIVPSVSVDKNTIALGEEVTFTMNAGWENGHYLNSRSLTFVYEDGTQETKRSSDSSSYAREFTPVEGFKHVYTWKPSKTGKIKVIYNVNQFEDHSEDSQVIVFTVR